MTKELLDQILSGSEQAKSTFENIMLDKMADVLSADNIQESVDSVETHSVEDYKKIDGAF